MDREMRASWAPKIRQARSARGMSQDELANAAETTRRTIGSIERGDTTPQPGILARVLGVLDLKPRDEDEGVVDVYLAMLAPLLLRIPKDQRPEVMRQVVSILTDAGDSPSG